MKRRFLLLLCASVVVAVCLFTACRSDLSVADDTSDTESAAVQTEPPVCAEPVYSLDGTIFRFGDRSFDITERHPYVNALMSCVPVGKHLVIEGHVGPKNGVYCIFNTETESFEKDIFGVNLIWREDDITTAVYSFWEGIYTYDGEQIAQISLEVPAEFIRGIAFVGETELLVTFSGESDDRTETVLLPIQ